MTAADILTPDFRTRTLNGRAVRRTGDYAPPRRLASLADAPVHTLPVAPAHLATAPDARRASPRLVDDFGIPATDPALIADLLLSLETAPWREEVIRVVRGVDGASRVHVAHGDRTFLLDPADARLAAAALDQEQAFAGCAGAAARLRDAARQADWARPYRRRDRHGAGVPLRQRLTPRRTSAVTLPTLILIGLALAACVLLAPALNAAFGLDEPPQAASVRGASDRGPY